MELKSAKCPNCGGKLQLNPEIEKGICIYCGSEIIVAEAIQKFRGEIDGLATTQTHLIRANQLFEDGETDKAAKEFQQVVNLNPTNAEAFMGLFRCAMASADYYLRLNHSLQRVISDYLNDVKIAKEKYGNRAVQYADADKKAEYEQYVNNAVSNAYQKAEQVEWDKTPLLKKGLAKLFGQR